MSKIIAWLKKWGLWILGFLAVVFGISRKIEDAKIRKQLQDASKESTKASEIVGKAEGILESSERILKEEEDKAAERKRKAKNLNDRLNKLIMLIILITLIPVVLTSTALCAEDNDALMKKYLEAIDIAKQYKDLYEESEKSNERLMEQVKLLQEQIRVLTETVSKLQKWIDELQNTILKLLGRRDISIVGGITGTASNSLPGWFLGMSVPIRF